jgi:hypothetical protein
MACAYAGVSLIPPTEDVVSWIENHLSFRELFPFNYSLVAKNLRDYTITGNQLDGFVKRPIEIGTLYWPSGACRWGMGFFLVDSERLQQIRSVVYADNIYTSAPLFMADDNTRIAPNMWMLPPRPLAEIPGYTGLWLLILVDDRYFWWQYNAGDLIVDDSTTFASLYSSLGTAVLQSIYYDPIATPYQNASQTLTSHFEAAPPLIDTVAYNCGQRIYIDLNNNVYAQNSDAAQNALEMELNKVRPVNSGGNLGLLYLGADFAGMIPHQVTFTFPKAVAGTLLGTYAVLDVPFTSTVLPLEFGSAVITNHTSKVFHESALANYSGPSSGDTWINSTECDALALQFATDWYRWQRSWIDIKLNGIVDWAPNAFCDVIVWTFRRDEVSTRIIRAPYNDRTEELMHSNSAGSPLPPSKITPDLIVEDDTGTPSYSQIHIIDFYHPHFVVSQTSPGEALITLRGGGGTSTTITTMNVDGTGVTPNVNTIKFNQSAGIFTFTIAAGIAEVSINVTTLFQQYINYNYYFSWDYDDYSLGGGIINLINLPQKPKTRLVVPASTTVRGIAGNGGGNPVAGEVRVIWNTGPANVTFNHQDGAVAAQFRVITPSHLPYTLYPDNGMIIEYDGTSQRWRFDTPDVYGPRGGGQNNPGQVMSTITAGADTDYAAADRTWKPIPAAFKQGQYDWNGWKGPQGRWYFANMQTNIQANTSTGHVLGSNTLLNAVPFLSPRGGTATALGAYISGHSAGRHIKLGLYDTANNPATKAGIYPRNKLAETVIDASNDGPSAGAINVVMDPGLYWIVASGEVSALLGVLDTGTSACWPVYGANDLAGPDRPDAQLIGFDYNQNPLNYSLPAVFPGSIDDANPPFIPRYDHNPAFALMYSA